MQCNNHLFTKKILINKTTCPRLSEAMDVIGFDVHGKGEKFTAHKGGSIDDYTDAFRYLINKTMPLLERAKVAKMKL